MKIHTAAVAAILLISSCLAARAADGKDKDSSQLGAPLEEAAQEMRAAQDPNASAEAASADNDASFERLLGRIQAKGEGSEDGSYVPGKPVPGGTQPTEGKPASPPVDKKAKRAETARRASDYGRGVGSLAGALPGAVGVGVNLVLPVTLWNSLHSVPLVGGMAIVLAAAALAVTLVGGVQLIRKGFEFGGNIGAAVGKGVGTVVGWVRYR